MEDTDRPLPTRKGTLDFSRTIALSVSALLDARKFTQLGPLIEQLLVPVQELRAESASVSVMQISDYQVLLEGRRFVARKALLWHERPMCGTKGPFVARNSPAPPRIR